MKHLLLAAIFTVTSFQLFAQTKYEIIREDYQVKDRYVYNVTSLKDLSYTMYFKEYLNNTLIDNTILDIVIDFDRKKEVKFLSSYKLSNDSTLSLKFRNSDYNGIDKEFKLRKMSIGDYKNSFKPYTIIPCESKSFEFVDGRYELKLETICQDYWNAADKSYKHCSQSDYSKKSLHYFEFGVIVFENEQAKSNFYKNK
ncbi:MAG: hypothetical protein J6Z01_15705 [Bacteroidales bacterium]|nr:hypothetical protein [Bacteroidales bacterium]